MYKNFMQKIINKVRRKPEVRNHCKECGKETIKKGRCLDCKIAKMNVKA